MRTTRRPTLAILASMVILAGMLTNHFVVAQPGSSGADSASLQLLVQVASSAGTYAQGAVVLASSSGLNVSSETALVAAGNASLLAAEAALSTGGDLDAGIQDAHDAMGNFTAAVTSAGTSIQEAGLTPTVDVQADLGTVASLNDSTREVSSIIDETCASTSVGPSLSGQFLQDCGTAKSWIVNATAELSSAASLLAAVETGAPGSSTAGFAGITSQARADIAGADAELSTLVPFTYASRGEAYANGPLASLLAAANASAELQGTLVGWFGVDASTYQSDSASQSSTSQAVTVSATAAASAISSVSMTSVTTSISAQQATLAGALSSLTSFSQAVAALPLPAGASSGLQSDATAAETSESAYDSSLSSLGSSAGSIASVTADGFSAYAATFYALGNTEGTEAAAFAASLASLQAQVGIVAGDFPLITALGTWDTTLTQLETTVGTGASGVSSSLQAAHSSTETVSSSIASLNTAVQAATQGEVSSSLLQNVSSVYASESQLLNSTALGSLSSASSSLQTEAQLASGFAASSQSLLSTSIAAFAAASQALDSQVSSLDSQSQSTSNSMSSASAYLTADLDARTGAVASASSLIAQAVAAFDALEVPQGAALLSQASTALTAGA
jgi:trimeric autotransporter adhesin